MPQKIDPYSTKLHSRINLLLLLLTLVLFALVLRSSAHGQTFAGAHKIGSEGENDFWWAERAATFFPRFQFTLASTNPASVAHTMVSPNAEGDLLYRYSNTAVTGIRRTFRIDGTREVNEFAMGGPDSILTTKTFSATSGSWSTSSNWSPSGVPTSSDDVLINAGTTTMTISNSSSSLTIQFLTYTDTSSRILENSGASSASTLTLGAVDGSGNLINVNPASGTPIFTIRNGSTQNLGLVLGASGNFNVGLAGATLLINSAISETGGSRSLTKTGSGTLTLGGTNTFSGGFTATGGITNINVNNALGSVTSVTVNTGATVQTPGTGTTNAINDSASVTLNGTGNLDLRGGSETVASLTSSSATSTLKIGDFGATPGSFTVGDNTFTVFAGIISGSRASAGAILTKQGSSGLGLSNVNTYSGDTAIIAGELRFLSGGSANSSTMRLGDTSANSPSATLSLGAFSGGNSISSPLEVRASASGTQGTRVLRSLATTGTNTYSGAITLNAGLTLESATGGTLLLQGGSVAFGTNRLTVDTQVDLNGADSVNMQGAVTINELLTSSSATGGSLVKDGGNTLTITSTGNTYTGNTAAGVALNTNGTRIRGGVLAITGDTSLGLAPSVATNNIFFEASTLTSPPSTRTLQASGGNVSLVATRNISVANGVTGTFDSNGNTLTVNGVINNPIGNGNIDKVGAGTLALTNANTFTGTTTITAGTLDAAAANALGSTSSVTVNSGGTLLLSNSGTNDRISDSATMKLNGQGSSAVSFDTGGFSEHGAANNDFGIGALTLQSSSIIDMGSAASIIAFANSAAQVANWSGTLSIYNWSGTPVTGGGTDQLYFDNNALGLTAAQLADFQFYSGFGTGAYAPGATILSTGEVVPLSPVPEPSTWLAAALALGALACTQRRRFCTLVRPPAAA